MLVCQKISLFEKIIPLQTSRWNFLKSHFKSQINSTGFYEPNHRYLWNVLLKRHQAAAAGNQWRNCRHIERQHGRRSDGRTRFYVFEIPSPLWFASKIVEILWSKIGDDWLLSLQGVIFWSVNQFHFPFSVLSSSSLVDRHSLALCTTLKKSPGWFYLIYHFPWLQNLLAVNRDRGSTGWWWWSRNISVSINQRFIKKILLIRI